MQTIKQKPTSKDISRAISSRSDNTALAQWCEQGVLDVNQTIRGESLKFYCIMAGNLTALTIFMGYGLELEPEDLQVSKDEGFNCALAYLLALQEGAIESAIK